ncbi:MAG: hypothetical protein ACLUZZ_03805 [Alistipes inops]
MKTSLSRTFIRSRMVRAILTKPTENWLRAALRRSTRRLLRVVDVVTSVSS